MEQERQLAIVHWHLGEHRRQRPEEERQPGPLADYLAAAYVSDMQRGGAAQVPHHYIRPDISHLGCLLNRQYDDNSSISFSSTRR
jgi:hypothetical protein